MNLQSGTEALALTVDDFSALEERVRRAVETIKQERAARAAAEERAAKAEAELASQSPAAEQLKEEVRSLRAERDHVRERVEKLLSQLDSLEL
ncbi:MAG: hypothetical protein KGN79_04775 [Acidobacteriota bacterium]|nr:hypothetical protein [Acidobacteriota bacterium]